MRTITGAEALTLFKNRSADAGDADVERAVADILRAVQTEGDAALTRFTERFDSVMLETPRVPAAAFDEAEARVPDELKHAIELAAARVRDFYSHQPKEGFLHPAEGALLGLLTKPLERVACYIPGGTAPLFSTLLMTAVPAQVAGVPDIVVATPPRKDGSVAPEILVTARLLGLSEVYRMGGAQAVAALAYGTEKVPRVDKIVGPGNRYVVHAKRLVYGAVGIEALPGPTETLVLADASAEPRLVAADLLAQAEHEGAQPVLVTPSRELAEAAQTEVALQLQALPTGATARASLERGYVVLVESLSQGLEVANLYAPEHLCLLVQDPWALLPGVKHAGGVFLGENSMEALGDYLAGPSHVMPTNGTARFSSAVNVRDFQKVMPLVNLSADLVAHIGPAAATMARAEGLEAHARAIEARLPRD